MKAFVAMALLGTATQITVNRNSDFDAQNIFNEFVVEAPNSEPVHLIQLKTPPGGAPEGPTKPNTGNAYGFPTTQQPGMGKDWPAGYGEDGFEKTAEYGGYHEQMYKHEPSHKWADPYYDPFDAMLHFRNGTKMPINRNAREMAVTKQPYTNGQSWTYSTNTREGYTGGGPQ